MRAVFPSTVAINLKHSAAVVTRQHIDGFSLHEMQMTVPPFLPTGIETEPPLFSSRDLLHRLTAALTSRVRLYERICLLPRYRLSAAKRLHGVFGYADDLCDFLVALALHAKVFYFCFLIVCHRTAPSLQGKKQKHRFLADFPTAIKITSVDDERRILTVRTLETVDERHEFVHLEVCRHRSDGCLCRGKKAFRLVRPIAVEERVLLCVAQCLAELLDEVVFEVEGVIVEKLLRHLDRNVELVRVEDNLVEGRLAKVKS